MTELRHPCDDDEVPDRRAQRRRQGQSERRDRWRRQLTVLLAEMILSRMRRVAVVLVEVLVAGVRVAGVVHVGVSVPMTVMLVRVLEVVDVAREPDGCGSVRMVFEG